MRMLVTGATGYVGSRLVAALLAEHHDVVVAGRRPARCADFGWAAEVTTVALDADDQGSVAQAFRQAGPIDVVYYLLHGIGQPGFRDTDNRAAANVAAAAAGAGARRIVYLGGFVPDGKALSEHLAGRAEVAHALSVDGGAELVWLGAAIIIGAGSTSFEMLRYVGDRFPVLPIPRWMANPIDPISVRDVLHYLVAAADPERVPAGAYDICGPETTTYHGLLKSYVRSTGMHRLGVPVIGIPTGVASRLSAVALPVPDGLAADLAASLDHPMTAAGDGLRSLVAEPPGGLLTVDEAIGRALGGRGRRPVNELADPHHLADTDPEWAGGDASRIRQLTPTALRAVFRLFPPVPGPVAGMVRSGLDIVFTFAPKGV